MNLVRLLAILVLVVLASGCEVVGGIFKAGMITGLLIIIAIMAIVFWIMGRVRRR